VTERRRQQRERAHEELLDATLDVARSEGWSGVTIRRVAAVVGVTSGALYRYVDSKDELIEGLVRRGFSELAERMRVAASNSDDALVAAIAAYVGFAENEPTLYRAMYGLDGADFVDSTNDSGRAVGEIIADAMRHTRRLDTSDTLHPAIVNLWALVHGLISLREAGRLPNVDILDAVRTQLAPGNIRDSG
jgi:AcrR family transcriptional regulator